MVRIRLSRVGRKNAPKYRVTVADSRKHVTKRFIEVVGFYNPNPRGKEPRVKLNMEKIEDWIKKGAQPTDRVKYLMKLQKQETSAS
ncbi:MAG: 30S ribosomal protein S16 [Pseudobdellovibrionaceae bacterium]|nr:30S ribosomal protein S16 [Pseudobdellovibrionaceae bacterium]